VQDADVLDVGALALGLRIPAIVNTQIGPSWTRRSAIVIGAKRR